MANEEPINYQSLIYINRLSDYFFLVSRAVNKAAGMEEKEWLPSK